MFYRLIASLVLIGTISAGHSNGAAAAGFPDPLIVQVADDGASLTLQSDFSFIDKRNRRWTAPRGTVVNGASIPRLFWSLVGAPFTGKHRKASVIHDYYCDLRTTTWQEVHNVFYEGLLAAKVDKMTAYVFWRAVHHFGPRWEGTGCDPLSGNCLQTTVSSKPAKYMPAITPQSLKAFQDDIKSVENARLKQSVTDLINNHITSE